MSSIRLIWLNRSTREPASFILCSSLSSTMSLPRDIDTRSDDPYEGAHCQPNRSK